MSFTRGKQLGVYEIVEVVGVGGMGKVYLARDARLGRDVAIKTLPAEFAQEPERLERFEREARILASLNHNNIASIHGLEELDGEPYLVLEMVPGETLEELISAGPMEATEALKIFRQIAAALDAAHQNGVVHRDLKPANIRITPAGVVKVLDFGLAKALAGDDEPATADSKTMLDASTQPGMILGTIPYMSPEQARGKPVDQRTDMWAFGCCLMETLTGHRVFFGETQSDTLSMVLRAPPEWEQLPADLPSGIRRLLRRCLAKEPDKRTRDAWEARLEIDHALGILEGGLDEDDDARIAAPTTAGAAGWLKLAGLALAGFVAGAAALWSLVPGAGSSLPGEPYQFGVHLPAGDRLVLGFWRTVALAPDGRTLVFVGSRDGVRQLFERPMGGVDATPIDGTAEAFSPFVSPDGAWIGFFADEEVKRVPFGGGVPELLADKTYASGASWGDDGILFSRSNESELWRVRPGEEAEPVTQLDVAAGEIDHRWPQWLPDGRGFLFTVWKGSIDDAAVAVQRAPGEPHRIIQPNATNPIILSDHLLFARPGTMLAIPFDLDTLQTTGSERVLLQGVQVDAFGAAHVALTETGPLVYVPATSSAISSGALVWVDHAGRETEVDGVTRTYWDPRLSRDGKSLGVSLLTEGRWDVWAMDLGRQTSTRLTFDGATNGRPVFSSDGERLAYASDAAGAINVFSIAVNGSGNVQQHTRSRLVTIPAAWTPDGRSIVFRRAQPETGWDIGIVDVVAGGADGAERMLLTGAFDELHPALSPDGRWLLYTSNESGTREVFVRPFPEVERGRWQISNSGGTEPIWAPDSRTVYYRSDSAVLSVELGAGDELEPKSPVELFTGDYYLDNLGQTSNFDIDPTGARFLFIRRDAETARRAPMNALINWQRLLLGPGR